ncbi:hypothetical protein [Xanthomonas vasicola]|nr:hypothetical protein [Xanthomonas vasicola]MBV6747223.1 hypothetical protein [Xanthomonas vasicola pv. vasculorum NCPPB 890]MBV6892707.1 hypothetical protein [Xanthomonas vasicola pv. vasculorum]MDO6948368.1 hypothetical protein [Xanthomonas vasicola]MDO6960457.1 hypothetical protein [Xanthomonas vasicola]
MSKYWTAIEEARPTITDPSVIAGLEKYLDESKLISQIYGKVRGALECRSEPNFKAELPTLDDIEREYRRALEDIYRRADKTVFERLHLATAA